MSRSGARRLTGIAARAIDRAIAGGQHQVRIASDGEVLILPLGSTLGQADEAALDAEIQDVINGDGDAAY